MKQLLLLALCFMAINTKAQTIDSLLRQQSWSLINDKYLDTSVDTISFGLTDNGMLQLIKKKQAYYDRKIVEIEQQIMPKTKDRAENKFIRAENKRLKLEIKSLKNKKEHIYSVSGQAYEFIYNEIRGGDRYYPTPKAKEDNVYLTFEETNCSGTRPYWNTKYALQNDTITLSVPSCGILLEDYPILRQKEATACLWVTSAQYKITKENNWLQFTYINGSLKMERNAAECEKQLRDYIEKTKNENEKKHIEEFIIKKKY